MSTRVKVTKADADKVLAAVKKAYRSWIKAGYTAPTLVKDWDWTGTGAAPYAVIWEEGPFEWALFFPFGGIEEEFGSNIADVSGSVPKAVFCEALTSWAIGIYPGW